MKIFTHIPYNRWKIKTGNARSHAQFQFDLHSFAQFSFSRIYIVYCKPTIRTDLIRSWIFRYFSFTFYILFAGKWALEIKRTFDQFTLTHSSLLLNFIAEGHLWAGNKSAQNLIVDEFLESSIVLLMISLPLVHSSCLFGAESYSGKGGEKECLSNQRSVNSCLANSPSVFVYRRWGGRGGRVRKRWRETPATKAAFLLHFFPYFNFPAVNSSPIRIRSALFRMTDFTREYRLKHEKIFATECRRLCKKFVKGDWNPMQTFKITEIVDFVELTSFLWKDESHLKTYFRRWAELKVRGWFWLIVAALLGCHYKPETKTCQNRSADLVVSKSETQLNCTVPSRNYIARLRKIEAKDSFPPLSRQKEAM